jgi:hypothetical protein
MWDDFGAALTGAGPTSTVQDPDGTPNNIIDKNLGATVQVGWSFTGSGAASLPPLFTFTVTLYADPVGPGGNVTLGPNTVAGTATLPSPPNPPYSYSTSIAIPTTFATGAYRLTAVITAATTVGGVSVPLAGFVDGPIIQVR